MALGRAVGLAPGEVVELGLSPEAIHLFDPESGVALR
jgi:hypothetical protein